MTVYILGDLDYHNETILLPILNELRNVGVHPVWMPRNNAQGASVHVSANTYETLRYWESSFSLPAGLADGDVLFVLDFWNPMVFNLKFGLTRSNKKVKLATIHHGSSQLPGDFASTREYNWTKPFEAAWFDLYDHVFFGSNVVMQKVAKEVGIRQSFKVTYLPVSSSMNLASSITRRVRKDKTVFMPLRLAADKGSDDFFTVVKNNPSYSFTCTDFGCDVQVPALPNLKIIPGTYREDLFSVMSEHELVLSCAKQETFGYAALEGVLCGCSPVLQDNPDNCYAEIYDRDCLFTDASTLNLDNVKRLNSPIINRMLLKKPEKVIVETLLAN